MKNMLPIPTKDYIPRVYTGADALCNKMDKIFEDIEQEILDLGNVNDPFKCKALALNTFAKWFNANVDSGDSEDVKRKRISTAVEDNKLFGTWIQNKNYIDSICGGDSKIVNIVPADDWVLCGNGLVENFAKITWAVLGGDNPNTKFGIRLYGEDDSAYVRGIYQIDVDNAHLTQSQINNLYKILVNSTPVGMTIQIGYLDEEEDFVIYFTLGGLR